MITAIIPARGGSKGIPRKNLVEVAGKPLISWTIEQALAAASVGRVIVSSDSREIGELARDSGAEWRLRSDETASDTAASEDALLEALDTLDYEPDVVVFLQATSPIRQPGDIDAAVEHLLSNDLHSVFSVRRIEGYTWTAEGGRLQPGYTLRQRRQTEHATRYEENGSIYVFRPWVLRDYHNRIGGRVGTYEMHPLDSYQIDEPEDIALLDTLIRVRLCDISSTLTV